MRARTPDLQLISFKYQENISLENLLNIARRRVEQGHSAVIANRGEEMGRGAEQIAYLVSRDEEVLRFTSKMEIAVGLCNWLERSLPM